ncbi:hypothetical protein RB195_012967 [Necator americanus]|uniref:Uncharacterized protein n=1 Tax=Necator americanus TaxID=51031 RepID=A0ABR1DTV6_NECAM
MERISVTTVLALFFISHCMVSPYMVFKGDNEIKSADKKYEKYVAPHRSKVRLGNQMLKQIVFAFSRIAEKFVIRTRPGTCFFDENYNLLRIQHNSIGTAEGLVYVPFAQNHGNRSFWKYEDPLRNITCIHTRQTDFIRLNRTTDLEETVMAAYNISEQHRSQQYLIFGDDRTFMAKLATRLKQMFRLASGFGIAKRFERTLYYYDVDELMLERLKQIVFAFPRTAEKFVVSAIRANGIPEQSVGLSESMNGRTTVAA